MSKSTKKCVEIVTKKCSLCNKNSEAEGMALVYFGDWMEKSGVTVHYYCLLLSTNLPQRGEDHSGILGFLLKDIRQEILQSKKRKCKYCGEMSATITCCMCKEYFHMTCGHTSKCLSQFVGDFKSYCHACLPEDPFQNEVLSRKPPDLTQLCFICSGAMGAHYKGWIYSKCCGNGYTHAKCMRIYALKAGYYLKCIWCKDKSFREHVKYLGVFVPDRDAQWEKERGAYGELYRNHKRCDMELCRCPRGRDYANAGKWQLITCKFCGAFGAHNPVCIPGLENSKEKLKEFLCEICLVTEQTILHKTISPKASDLLDMTLYVNKEGTGFETDPTAVSNHNLSANSTQKTFDVQSSSNMQITVDNFALTQSPPTSQTIEQQVAYLDGNDGESSDTDSSIIVDILVQRMLDVFEPSD